MGSESAKGILGTRRTICPDGIQRKNAKFSCKPFEGLLRGNSIGLRQMLVQIHSILRHRAGFGVAFAQNRTKFFPDLLRHDEGGTGVLVAVELATL